MARLTISFLAATILFGFSLEERSTEGIIISLAVMVLVILLVLILKPKENEGTIATL